MIKNKEIIYKIVMRQDEEKIEKFKKVMAALEVVSHGEYNKLQNEVEIICKKNHKFSSTPAKIYKGSWCKVCKGEEKPRGYQRFKD